MRRFRFTGRAVMLLGLGLALLAPGARADIVDVVNGIRRDGCGGLRGGRPSLQRQSALTDAARRLAAGTELGTAMADAGYRADTAFSAHVSGTASAAQTAAVLSRQFCARLLDAQLTEAGGYERGRSGWVIVAAPARTSALADPRLVADRVLALVNAARAQRRNCGVESMAATTPLAWSEELARAARVHALDMERNGFFEHAGSDGSDPLTRVSRTGYGPRAAGENLAFNQETPEDVVRGWLASPHHCANIMDPRFRELGVAYVISRQREQSIYWDLTLGARGNL
jgi:uncharacterized protein YkwD